MRRRAAAERFGAAPSTAVELLRQWRATGAYEARRQGGDRRSGPIEAHAVELVALVETTPGHHARRDRRPPVRGTRRALRAERGLVVFRAACHQFQKKRRTPAGGTGQTWWRNARHARPFNLTSISTGWCSSMRRVRRRRWRASTAVLRAVRAVSHRFRTATGNRRRSSARSG
jgi:transposase